jgi:hypothetical protein
MFVNVFLAGSATLIFEDATHPDFPTAIENIDLTLYGFGRYDVFFVSGREQTVDGWGATEAVYRSDFTSDVFPNVSDSSEFSHLIKREIVRALNANSILFISGLSSPGTQTFEHHTNIEGGQQILLPYLLKTTGGINSIEGTFATKSIATGEWGTDDLVGNLFNASLNAGSSAHYWGIVTDSMHEIVLIDIKPGGDDNCVNINGNGVIPVAVLGSADFDVNDINIDTLSFAGLAVRVKGNDARQCSVEDVSGDFTTPEGAPDGHPDLVCQFVDDPMSWNPGDGTATLTGELLDVTLFEGTDSICIVP